MSEAACMNICPNRNGCQVLAMLTVLEGHEEAIMTGGLDSLLDIEEPDDLDGVLTTEDHFKDMVSGKVEAPQGVSMYAEAAKQLGEFRQDVAESCAGPKLEPRHPLLRAIGFTRPKKVCGQTIETDEFYNRLKEIVRPIFDKMDIGVTAYDKHNNVVPMAVRVRMIL